MGRVVPAATPHQTTNCRHGGRARERFRTYAPLRFGVAQPLPGPFAPRPFAAPAQPATAQPATPVLQRVHCHNGLWHGGGGTWGTEDEARTADRRRQEQEEIHDTAQRNIAQRGESWHGGGNTWKSRQEALDAEKRRLANKRKAADARTNVLPARPDPAPVKKRKAEVAQAPVPSLSMHTGGSHAGMPAAAVPRRPSTPPRVKLPASRYSSTLVIGNGPAKKIVKPPTALKSGQEGNVQLTPNAPKGPR